MTFYYSEHTSSPTMSTNADFVFDDELLSVAPAPVALHCLAPRRLPTAFGALGSIFMRVGWKPQAGLSGMAIAAPPFPGAQTGSITLLTDDSVPPAAGGAHAANAPSLTLPTVQKKMEDLKGRYELLVSPTTCRITLSYGRNTHAPLRARSYHRHPSVWESSLGLPMDACDQGATSVS